MLKIRSLFLLVILTSFSFAMMSCEGENSESTEEETADTTATAEEEPLKASEIINDPNTADVVEDTSSGGPRMSFEQEGYEFGTIYAGDKVNYNYTFTNTGDAPLIISNASASCGCTVPEWPKDPIEPGESGEIKVEFDSKGKMGKQNKTVSITANTNPNNVTLQLTGEVLPGAPAEGPVAK
jgi:hypothetical protein